MNKNNLSNLTNKLRESKIHNGSTIIGVKDFLNFADNNDIGFTRNDALELAEEFKVKPSAGLRTSQAEQMIDITKLE